MNELMEKYAKVLLNTCLKIEQNQPLFISANVECYDFVRIIGEVAYEQGISDIYYDLTDPYLKRSALQNLPVDDLKKMSYWDKSIWDIYAQKNAAFLMLASEMPGLMREVDPKKMSELTSYSYQTRQKFNALRDKSALAWCIAVAPTKLWAQELFPTSPDPVHELWQHIFEICSINQDNVAEIWQEKIALLHKRAQKLNSYQFKTLRYQSSNGTNFTIDLPANHIWASGSEHLQNNKDVLVNFPTEEVFTSPDYKSAEGVVYSSKPLAYQDVLIKDFNITFSHGAAILAHASEGEETLKELIKICPNSNYLGEVALVPYNSPISQSNITFLETLYDENSACHLALGASFPECLKDGTSLSREELLQNKLNQCDSHVDFMIGTKDLNITGITKEGQDIAIFKDGNFTEEFV